ncbi:MAG: cardiolipin synthase [bacterium]
MDILFLLLSFIFILNISFIILIIFLEKDDPSSTWAWISITALFPVFGFVAYLFIGLSPRKAQTFQKKVEEDEKQEVIFSSKDNELQNNEFNFDYLEKNIIRGGSYNRNSNAVGLNEIKIYTNGRDKFDDLFKDLKSSKQFIHAQYFRIRDDQVGNKFLNILTEKARQGVDVRLIYDSFGSKSLARKTIEKLKDAGGKAFSFSDNILSFNYRHHRKNVIIDGQIGYIGGINVGDEYLSRSQEFGYWRDTHLRLQGESVDNQQHRFLLDWNFVAEENLLNNKRYFPPKKATGKSPVQIISSGPDLREEAIKILFLKMIYGAEKNIYIQTPYFIPDQAVLEALKTSARSGIDVRIMIPNQPDHPFVYSANTSFVEELLEVGARCYQYARGFIHSKTISIDGRILSGGTCNMDVRSFKLNFEINAFIYDSEVAKRYEQIFKKDLEHSNEIIMEEFKNRDRTMKIKESFSRLLSPIL